MPWGVSNGTFINGEQDTVAQATYLHFDVTNNFIRLK
jgi:hypothetical protein